MRSTATESKAAETRGTTIGCFTTTRNASKRRRSHPTREITLDCSRELQLHYMANNKKRERKKAADGAEGIEDRKGFLQITRSLLLPIPRTTNSVQPSSGNDNKGPSIDDNYTDEMGESDEEMPILRTNSSDRLHRTNGGTNFRTCHLWTRS